MNCVEKRPVQRTRMRMRETVRYFR